MALKYEKSCGALVFRQDPRTGRMYILMIRHKHGGHRSFPKGHVEEGETEHQTAIREVEEERIEQIEAAIGFDELESAASMHADFEETLYYKGYAYIFNEKGFLGKAPITDKTYLEQSDTAAIRVVNADGEVKAEETFIINTEEEGDENTP